MTKAFRLLRDHNKAAMSMSVTAATVDRLVHPAAADYLTTGEQNLPSCIAGAIYLQQRNIVQYANYYYQ